MRQIAELATEATKKQIAEEIAAGLTTADEENDRYNTVYMNWLRHYTLQHDSEERARVNSANYAKWREANDLREADQEARIRGRG